MSWNNFMDIFTKELLLPFTSKTVIEVSHSDITVDWSY